MASWPSTFSRALGVFVALGSTGCGATIAGSYPLDMPFLRAHNETVVARTPLAPPQTSARYTLASGPLRVVCQTETVTPQVAIRTEETFDGVQRVLVGFMALGETAFVVALPGRDAVRMGDAGSWAVAGVVQADALFALGYAIFAPSRENGREEVVRGEPLRSGTCPPGIVVRSGGQGYPVDPWGRIPGGARAAGTTVDFGASLDVGGRVATWTPTAAERCSLARESGHPMTRAVCNESPALPPPLPPPPRPGLPDPMQWNGSVSFP